MAQPKTLYVVSTAPVTGNNWHSILQDGGTAPTAANATFGYAPGKLAASSFCKSLLGSSTTSATTSASSFIDSQTGPVGGSSSSATGDCFRAGPYTGTFASAAWTFTWNLRAGVAGLVGRLRMRVWKSANANGTSATALTGSTQLGSSGTLSTSSDLNSSMSWSPGAITLNNEYLFFQLEFQEQTSAGSSNTDTALYRIGSNIVTPDFEDRAVVSQTLGTLGQTAAAYENLIFDPNNKNASLGIGFANQGLTGPNTGITTGVGAIGRGSIGRPASSDGCFFEVKYYDTGTPGTLADNIGLVNASHSLTGYVGQDTNGVGFDSLGNIKYNGSTVASAVSQAWYNGDLIGVALLASSIEFYYNGRLVYTYTGTMPSGTLYPACGFQNDSGLKYLINGGQGLSTTGAAGGDLGDYSFRFFPYERIRWDMLPFPGAWNPADVDSNILLSRAGRVAKLNAAVTSKGVRGATSGSSASKQFVEFKIDVGDGSPTQTLVGLANSSADLTAALTGSTNSIMIGMNGTYYGPSGSASSGTTFTAGDVIGVGLPAAGGVEFYKNGTKFLTLATLPTGSLYPAATIGDQNDQITINGGSGTYTNLPRGYTSWDGTSQSNLDATTSLDSNQTNTNITLTGSGLIATGGSGLPGYGQFALASNPLTPGLVSGGRYWEATVNVKVGVIYVSMQGEPNKTANYDSRGRLYPGRGGPTGMGCSYRSDGEADSWDGDHTYGSVGTYTTFAVGDVIGVLMLSDTAKFYKNGTLIVELKLEKEKTQYAAIGLSSNTDQVTVNFGATAFSNLPVGAVSWDGSQPAGARNAVVAQTLGTLVQSATAAVTDAGVVSSQSLGTLGQSASAAAIIAATTSQTLGALTQTLTATAKDTAVVNQTLGTLQQVATALATVAAAVNQSLGTLGQTAAAAAIDVAAVSQTLGALNQAATAGVVDTAAVSQSLGALQQAAAMQHTPATAVYAGVFGALGQAATAAANLAASVSQSLGNLGQTATAAAGLAAVVNQSFGVLGQAATATAVDSAVVSQALGALQQAATAAATVAATVAQTLPALTQATTGGPVDQATAAQTLGALQQAVAAAVTATANVSSQSLGALQQVLTVTTGAANVNAVVDQTLGALGQAATAAVPVAAAVSQSLGALGQALTAAAVDAASVAQTLPTLAQAATAAVTDLAAVSQSLGALGQAAAASAVDAAVVSQSLGPLGQAAAAGVVDAAAVNQALGALQQAASAGAVDTAVVNQFLGALGQAASAGAVASAAVSQALGAINQAAAAGVVDTAVVNQSLGVLGQSAFSTQQSTGNVNQSLGALGQVAAGQAIDAASAAQILGSIVQVLTGVAIDSATVTQALGNLQQVASAVHVSFASVDQTLPSLGQVATAEAPVRATVSQVLGTLAQIATATTDQSAHAAVDQLLGALQQVATSSDPVAAQANQLLGALLQSAAARGTRIPHHKIHGSFQRSRIRGSFILAKDHGSLDRAEKIRRTLQ